MYLEKIEEYFFKYRRHGTILSPQNWLIAERWEQMGIPINIVCKGIKEACRKFRSTHQEGEERIDMLTYCEPEILRLWKDYKKALLGSPADGPKGLSAVNDEQQKVSEMIRTRLESIRQNLCEEAKESGSRGDLKLKALAGIDWSSELDAIDRENCEGDSIDIDAVEKRLSALDRAFVDALLQLLSKEKKADWTREIEERLSAYKNQMDENSYRETVEMGMEGLLRERFIIAAKTSPAWQPTRLSASELPEPFRWSSPFINCRPIKI